MTPYFHVFVVHDQEESLVKHALSAIDRVRHVAVEAIRDVWAEAGVAVSIARLTSGVVDDVRVLWVALSIAHVGSHFQEARLAVEALVIACSKASIASRVAVDAAVARGVVVQAYRLAVRDAHCAVLLQIDEVHAGFAGQAVAFVRPIARLAATVTLCV